MDIDLQEVINSGIISNEVLESLKDNMKKQKVNSIHNYEITSPKGEKGRWQTYVKEDDKRKKLVAPTEKILYDKLYSHYFESQEHTLLSLYPIWVDKRKNENVSERTVRRNNEHWNKYYLNHKLVNIPLSKLNADLLENFFHEIIRTYNITLKELNNMKFICGDMLRIAKRKGYIENNPFTEMIINTYACKPAKKTTDTSRVYLPYEKQLLFTELNNQVNKYPYCTDAYVVFLLFKLGLRIGEVVALQWNDLSYEDKEIHVHSMETLIADERDIPQPIVVNYTKKKSPYGDRFLPIGEYELAIFDIVKKVNTVYGYKEGEYIFCNERGRTKSRDVDRFLRRVCKTVGIIIKSAHDIRRTVASEMFNNGVQVELIRNYMGHSDIKTTYGYILNNHDKEETAKIIMKSLQDMSGLICSQVFSKQEN